MKKNAFYAQSGGVTSVINASAAGVIVQARNSKKINKVLAGKTGGIAEGGFNTQASKIKKS